METLTKPRDAQDEGSKQSENYEEENKKEIVASEDKEITKIDLGNKDPKSFKGGEELDDLVAPNLQYPSTVKHNQDIRNLMSFNDGIQSSK